ncbi:MAG: dinitrogenase iron-molybdenum cofactor biosynthesis protein [Thiohalocapsa sp.]|jgi:nitrogen fixation protein NifX|uniref:dinitrogenase iron-molybdenum cofactor biosynthesis protein n=1 Tax=Thiohalocapsa sp. TaxID=2497641 RepID=UPI0025E65C9B|nr:dinitrogenase iron-molybdenum cofactor biosynthesis protein [Thiohalocapsa sp.]MCG6942405.1 dinitrogenase iron-molybdenum cofactor biosynthesis protein [Thiohalocapsa sp.]
MTDPVTPEATAPALSDDIALRIGLAARALPDTDPARLLKVLADAVGLPPTVAALDGLTVKQLKTAAAGELAEVDAAALKAALALLKGQGHDIEPPPPVEAPLAAGEAASGSIRVACASNGGDLLDGHFGSCRRFLVYQVAAGVNRLVDVRDIDDSTADDDKNAYRAELITDCQVLFVASIGGPAAAKVVKRDIHPIKFPQGGSARERMAELSAQLAHKPAPWLAKVMGQSAEERVRFERDTEDA